MMKKISLLLILAMCFSLTYAQDDEGDQQQDDQQQEEQKEGWTHLGNFSLIFNQAAFNADWQDGGTSNYAGNLSLDYAANYKEGRLSWDNSLIAEFGLTKIKGDDFMRKTNDQLELNSVLGYQVEEGSRWYYSFFGNFKTQFAKGYEYNEDVGGERIETTGFMSPGYLKFGPGMLYKNDEILKINIAPATARFIFVDDKFTTVPGYEDGDYYGLDRGKSMRFEFGASVDIVSKVALLENVDLKNRLSLYSNYLEDPQNVDIDYTMKLDMKINEFLSANFVFQAIYDDNTVTAFQIREALGVGFSYKLK